MMDRLSALDLPERFADVSPRWLTKAGCALLGLGLAVSLRAVVDAIAPGAGPFALIYPAALVATLLGGWEAGLATVLIAEVLALMFVRRLSETDPFDSADAASAVIFLLSAATVVAVAEGFRRAGKRVVAERSAKLAERDLLFRELRHRVANDFTIVNSLLELQRRSATSAETKDALLEAATRVRNFARAHQDLYDLPEVEAVDFRRYVQNLATALKESALPAVGVTLTCASEAVLVDRDRALSLGVIANELVTNAVKHAFADGRQGEIEIAFARHGEAWRLSVRDNGVGLPPQEQRHSGLGTGLLEAFATKAGGVLSVESQPGQGTMAAVDLPADAARPALRS